MPFIYLLASSEINEVPEVEKVQAPEDHKLAHCATAWRAPAFTFHFHLSLLTDNT